MASRSYIGIEKENGVVEFVYCHWHGHPKDNGIKLYKIYNTEKKIDKLLSYGDISSLSTTIKDTAFFSRDFLEEWDSCKPATVDIDMYLTDSYNAIPKARGEYYRYLFTMEKKWIVFDTTIKKTFDVSEYILFLNEELDKLYNDSK